MCKANVVPLSYLLFFLPEDSQIRKITQRQVKKVHNTDFSRPIQRNVFASPPPPDLKAQTTISLPHANAGRFYPISLFCLGLKWTFHLYPLSPPGPKRSDPPAPQNPRLAKNKGVWGGSGEEWKGEQRGQRSRKEIILKVMFWALGGGR